MHWFFIALVSPVLTSFGNFIDKVLTEKYISKDASIWVLSLYSSLFSLLVAPILWILNPDVLSIEVQNAAILMLAGVVEITSVFLYLNALRDEDTSTVVPVFQTIPFFAFILGFLVLGETLTSTQLAAGAVIVLGGVLLTIEFSKEKTVSIRLAPLAFMLAASFSFALYDTLFKLGALEESFWVSVFWQHVGMGALGLFLFVSSKLRRKAFLSNVRENGSKVLGLNILNESLYTVGVGFYSYALLLVPIAIVATVNVYQPIIVFFIGLFFTLFLPHILSERISAGHIMQKLFAIFVILIGSVYLAG